MIETNRKKIGFILTRAYFLVHYLWQHMFSFVIWYIFLKVQNNASVTIIKKGKRINFSCIALCVILNWSLYNPQIPGPNPKILSYPACTHVSKHTNQIVRLKYFLSHLLRLVRHLCMDSFRKSIIRTNWPNIFLLFAPTGLINFFVFD